MATPAAALLNENLQIHKGERADAPRAKPLKPSGKHGLQGRKALMDVSNVPKGTALKDRSTLKERSILKEKPTLKERSTVKERPTLKERPALKERSALQSHQVIKNPVKIFADEETQKCHEWAKDGVEGAHFTGNDSQKLDKDMQDKRVKKKVGKVMSALHVWSDVVFDPVMFPASEVAKFSEGVKELELEPEVLPNITGSGKIADAPRAKPPKPSAKPREALQDVSNTLIERPALRYHEVIKNPVKIFADEETKRCHDWVVEGAHFTGNDSRELDKDVQEKCDKAKLAEDFLTDDELDQYPFLDNNPVKFELRDEPVISEQGAI